MSGHCPATLCINLKFRFKLLCLKTDSSFRWQQNLCQANTLPIHSFSGIRFSLVLSSKFRWVSILAVPASLLTWSQLRGASEAQFEFEMGWAAGKLQGYPLLLTFFQCDPCATRALEGPLFTFCGIAPRLRPLFAAGIQHSGY